MPGLRGAFNVFNTPTYIRIGAYGAAESTCVDVGELKLGSIKENTSFKYVEAHGSYNSGLIAKDKASQAFTIEAELLENDFTSIGLAMGLDPVNVTGASPTQSLMIGVNNFASYYRTCYLYTMAPSGNIHVIWIPKCLITTDTISRSLGRDQQPTLHLKIEALYDTTQTLGSELVQRTERVAATSGAMPVPVLDTGVYGTSVPVSALSATGTTATATYAGAALVVGTYIKVAGATPSLYNGVAIVTASALNSVSYTVIVPSVVVASLTGGVATTSTAHGHAVGDVVQLSGAVNAMATIASVPSTTTFTYTVITSIPAASGTLSYQPVTTTGLAGTVIPSLVFSRQLLSGTANSNHVFLVNTTSGLEVPITISWNSSTRVLTLTPVTSPLTATSTYRIVVTRDVVDLSGNAMSGTYTSSFAVV